MEFIREFRIFTIGCTIVNHDVTCRETFSIFVPRKLVDNSLCDRLYGQLQYISFEFITLLFFYVNRNGVQSLQKFDGENKHYLLK